jgi:amino acid transporter
MRPEGEGSVAEKMASVAADGAGVPATRLEPDAIGVAEDTVIGMANAAPTVSIGLSIAVLAGMTAYGSGPIILLTAVPMLIIANAYRRLNLWNANCGASFEWVGRSINPYLGFFTGWLMIAGSLIGTVSGVIVLAPSVLAIFGASTNDTFYNVIISLLVIFVMLAIAIVGIRLTARTQVGMAAIEYLILVGIAVWGLVAVLNHHPGTFPISSGWFSINGIHGLGSASAGFLTAVFMYTGWDATVYVNEETKRRRVNPGRAAMYAVIALAIIFTFATVGLQGVLRPKTLQKDSSVSLVAIAHALGGPGWEKVMALSLALSVIASTGTGIVVVSRLIYSMASHRTLPEVLSIVSRRFSTPIVASLVMGAVLTAATIAFLVTSSVKNAFNDVISETGLLYAGFYVLTALATIVYFRRQVMSSMPNALILGILPLGSAAFLVWLVVKSVEVTTTAENVSLEIIFGAGIVLMLLARFVLKSPFFRITPERANK